MVTIAGDTLGSQMKFPLQQAEAFVDSA